MENHQTPGARQPDQSHSPAFHQQDSTQQRKRAFTDGSNLTLSLRQNGKPSVFLLALAIQELERQGFDVETRFDNSIWGLLKQQNAASEIPKLKALIENSEGKILCTPHVDPMILGAADVLRNSGAVVVNGGDKYQTWIASFGSRGLPKTVRVSVDRGCLRFDYSDGQKAKLLPVRAECTLYGVRLVNDKSQGEGPVGDASPRSRHQVLGPKKRLTRSLSGRLLTFAIDSSASMLGCQTYDGRSKAAHVAEVLSTVTNRLCASAAAPSFYASLITFAGEPQVTEIGGSTMVHVSHLRSFLANNAFDHMTQAKGNGTDIKAALTKAVSNVDSVLSAPENKYIFSTASALVVLITDGQETCDEAAVRNAIARFGMNKRLKGGAIQFCCVAIGKDANVPLLREIASSPNEQTLKVLDRAGLAGRLLKRSSGGPCLAIKVDEKTPDYHEVIRNFIDVVSESATT